MRFRQNNNNNNDTDRRVQTNQCLDTRSSDANIVDNDFSDSSSSLASSVEKTPPEYINNKPFKSKSTQRGVYIPPHKSKRGGSSYRKKERDHSSVTLTPEEREKNKQRLARFGRSKSTPKEEFGLVSRGNDTRLRNNEHDRVAFYRQILFQFVRFCSCSTPNSLHLGLTKLLNEEDYQSLESPENNASDPENITMDSILLSTRKLREALLCDPPSAFHKKVFMFSVRISSVLGHYQTYIPSINYLILHRAELDLSDSEFEEIVTILILHLVHLNENIAQAIRLFFRYIPHKKEILTVIQSWINGNYYHWIRIYNEERNEAILSLMKLGHDKMVCHLIKTIGCCYYTLQKSDLEQNYLPHDLSFDDLVSKHNINWKLSDDGKTVVIRERRKKVVS
ncbi:conserved hypothetical protein [Candida dubliniensis CD36]|uniref:Uncharacterized protein n=1 Tax=Candida dubliniensis (strain CD36 / ATCC MYA-646 / CBS 7987 / NCPF 3949 / NRRL Y-17841) TaxID=573826 RepID=B9WGP9_CANDC|nr:conserved hypothetical protein [Candida dubliniensis CD36]CAX42425.1 conserved hypothetical protein [Candida dubliniensis CD36]